MSIIDVLLSSADFAILIPAALMCILPVKHHCRVNVKLMLPVLMIALLVISLFCGTVRVNLGLNTNTLLFPLMIVAMIFYFMFFRQSKIKMLYIFVSVTAVLSFSGLSSYIVEAVINKNGQTSDVQTYGLLTQWTITLFFFVCFILILPKIRWLIDDYHINSIWKFIWIVPTVISLTNVCMIPNNYSNVSIGKLFEVSILAESVLILLYVLYQVMLYLIAKAITDKTLAEQQSNLMSIQAKEYDSLKKYIENTSRLRHDFLHMARTARQLAKNNDTETLIKLLESYGVSIENSHSQKIFCEHNALNAIVGHYYEEALRNNIKCEWKIAIANNIAISDTDLCSVVGNLLDNAIHGCVTVDESNRLINFKADIEKGGDIYIVMTNSFNGIVKKKNDKYISTKSNGNGIGLESIKATVNKHNGYVKFYNDRKNFYTDIMIKQDV